MFRLFTATLLALALLNVAARAEEEIKGVALVKVEDPKKGTVPELVYGYGAVAPSSGSSSTFSFPRDGSVTKFYVEANDPVKKGDKLLEFATAPDVVTAYQQAASLLKLTKSTRDRTAQLYAQQLATRIDLDNAEHAVLDAEMVLSLQELKGGAKPTETLLAPFDGVVTTISVSQGDRLTAGAQLMTLTRFDQLVLIVGVEPGRIDKVKAEQPVRLESLSSAREPISGKVRRVGAAIDPKTRLASAIIDMPMDGLLAGESFRAGIEVGRFQGWVVPRGAVGRDDKGSFIFQIDNNKAKRVNVKPLGTAGDVTVFEGDIDLNLEIVVNGNYQLIDGAEVRIDTGVQKEDEDE